MEVEVLDKRENWVQQNCQECNICINGELEWHKHLKTKKHKHLVQMKLKQASGLTDREFY